MRHTILLLALFALPACSLFRPHVESPCAGMLCASLISVPTGQELLVCAKTQLELDRQIRSLRERGAVR